MQRVKTGVVACVVLVLVLVTGAPLSNATAAGKRGAARGNGSSAQIQSANSDKSSRARMGARAKHGTKVRKQKKERVAQQLKKDAKKAAKAARAAQKELRQRRRIGATNADESATAPPKLRGRANAFSRIVAKLWRMPESALKGLRNALSNIGKWIGLVPPEPPYPTPEPPAEPTPGPSSEPTRTPDATGTPS